MKNLKTMAALGVAILSSTALAQGPTAPATAPRERLVGISLAEAAAQCQASQTVMAERPVGPQVVRRRDPAFDCVRAIQAAYEMFCAERRCDEYVLGGVVVWTSGLELNIPRLGYVSLGSHPDIRGVVGYGYMKVQEVGTNRTYGRHSLLVQPTLTFTYGSARAGENAQRFQIPAGGISIVLIPNGQTGNLAPADIYSRPAQESTTIAEVLSHLLHSQIGGAGEVQNPLQADLFANTSIVGAITTNLPGIGYQMGIPRAESSMAVFLNAYLLKGRIRGENWGLQMGPMLELYSFGASR